MKIIKVESCRGCDKKHEYPAADVWWCGNTRLTNLDTIHPSCPLCDYPDHIVETNKTINPEKMFPGAYQRDHPDEIGKCRNCGEEIAYINGHYVYLHKAGHFLCKPPSRGNAKPYLKT